MSDKNSIEKIYQKKSQLEHILLRPDTYIGSVEHLTQEMWIWDFVNEKMIKKEITFVPGLYKIFDEILVNAADNKQRDKNMSLIRINIEPEKNLIRIYNNGKGIPVVEHKEEKIFVPTLIFGHLLTSSNYDDDEKKTTGGRNGYGAKLCNIFSKKFIVETSSKEYKKHFKQVWCNNMSRAEEPIIEKAKEDDYTCVTFSPDLSKFKMDKLDDDTVALLARRAYDIAACSSGVKVYLNDKRLPVSKFEDYCKLYLNNEQDELGNAVKLLYERANERWEIAIAPSDIGFQQVSFVNSIATTKGGRHVDYICDQLVKNIGEAVKKKNKSGAPVKPFQIKNYMWLFINCLVENPTFDSQTKENMTLQSKSFGSKCQLSEEFSKKVAKSGILEKILTWLAFKEKTDLEKSGPKSKQSKIKGIPKLDDANDAGTKDSLGCTLILTEGDSAKTLAVAGLGVIGRDKYGVFPLRGKMLNVREASTKQILENAEVTSLLKIIGLSFKEKYENKDSLKQLRYGKIMIMTDQDHDGSHIKGLIVNFIHHKWPNLLKHGFVEEFITPIVKVSKGNREKSFYSMPEFEEWQQETDNWMTWKIKYYKGLGTSTSKEAKEYFSDMNRHRIKFEYQNVRDDLAIQLAFSKKFIEERKDWLTMYMTSRKNRLENHESEDYLYKKDTQSINYTDFINKELVLFSNLDNERSIPSVMDGLKPGQRKVMFTCFKRNLVKELKVAQLAGSVAELSSYHHGEQSLMSTIIGLAQNFVGSNNINLLQPIGQFGTRLHGGKDAASPRYIFTALSVLTRLIFNPKDDPLLSYINDDGQRVEPHWYCPILPMVLVNGAEGIGTGWSTKIPNYNPRDIVNNLKRLIKKEDLVVMKPFYKNFRGSIEQVDGVKVVTSGEIAVIDDNSIEITELPVSVWTQQYKENVLECYLHGDEKTKVQLITDYREYHTDATVRFVIKMDDAQFREARSQGFHKYFKLQKPLSLNSMVLFDHLGCLKRYDSALEILKEFYHVRHQYYIKRKAYMEGTLQAESLKLDNVARFILEKIEGILKVENVKRADIIKQLKSRKYDADPVNKWKTKIAKADGYEGDLVVEQDDEEGGEESNNLNNDKHDYDYLLSMPIWNLTMEKKDELLKQQKAKGDELKALREKTPDKLWLDDLEQFLLELDKVEAKEREDENATITKSLKAAAKTKVGTSKKAAGGVKVQDYMPDPNGERVEPAHDEPKDVKPKKEKKEDSSSTIVKESSLVDLITLRDEKFKNMNNKEMEEFAAKLLLNPKQEKKEKVEKVKVEKKVKKESNGNSDDLEILGDTDDENESKQLTVVKKETTQKKSRAPAKKKTDDKQSSIDKYLKKKKKDDESFSEGDIEEVDLDDVEPMSRSPRSSRNKKPTSYKGLDDDDDDIDGDVIQRIDDDPSDESFTADKENKETASKKRPAKKRAADSDNEDAVEKKKPNKAAVANPKKSPIKKIVASPKKPTSNGLLKIGTTTANKKSKKKQQESDDQDDESLILDDTDDEFEAKKKSLTKKKLMSKEQLAGDLNDASDQDVKPIKKKKKAQVLSDDD